jgi:hypothetical protein
MTLVIVIELCCSIAIAQTTQSGAVNNQATTPAAATGATAVGPTNAVQAAGAPSAPTNSQGPSGGTTTQPTGNGAGGTKPDSGSGSPTATDVATKVKDVKAIRDALSADTDLDFSLVVGIGSLIVVSGSTDYSDQSNVIHSNNLGKATPQFLAGVSFRSPLPNIIPRYRGCHWDSQSSTTPTNSPTPTADAAAAGNAGQHTKETPSASANSPATLAGDTVTQDAKNVKVIKDAPGADTTTPTTGTTAGNSGQQEKKGKKAAKVGSACGYAEPWQKRPWNAFVSVKFAPGASQTINGFVFGASYSLTKYLSALVGFSLTPINEPSPGFRTTAAQFVTAQQKLGQDLNFNPAAMLSNSANAFDGFPVTDPSGKLIYTGNPLTVHYHGGAVFGVSIPIYFSSVFK